MADLDLKSHTVRKYCINALTGALIASIATYACDNMQGGPAVTAFALCALPLLTMFISYTIFQKLDKPGLHTFVTHCVLCTLLYLTTFTLYLVLCMIAPNMSPPIMLALCLVLFLCITAVYMKLVFTRQFHYN